MAKYEADLAKVVAARQELANATKLLELPVTTYPEVVSIQKDMQSLRQIYDIFKAQKVRYGACQLKVRLFIKTRHHQHILKSFRIQKQNGLRPYGWI